MPKPAVVILILLAAGVGFAAGRFSAPPPPKAGPTLPPSRSKTDLPEGFAPVGVTHDLREALLDRDLLARTRRVAELLGGLGPESLEPVQTAFESVLVDVGDTELVLFGEWWGRFDPRAALRWSMDKWSARLTPMRQAVMRAWGRDDPTSALAAALAAPDDRVRLRWTDAVLRGWDESVHDGALEYAESLAPGPERQWALYVVTRRRVLRDGPDAAIAWAEDLPDDDALFKLNAFRRVAGAAASVDPQAASAFVERHLEGPYARGMALRVGTSWIEDDPDAAFRWLSTLPAGRDRNEAVRESFYHWLALDTEAAHAWIEAAPREPWLDPALAVYATSLGRRDPVAAIALAEGIHDEDIRNPALGHIARMWLRKDEAAANAWLARSGLSPEFIEKIRALPGLPGTERGEPADDRTPAGGSQRES